MAAQRSIPSSTARTSGPPRDRMHRSSALRDGSPPDPADAEILQSFRSGRIPALDFLG
jgi:hypothetical protein